MHVFCGVGHARSFGLAMTELPRREVPERFYALDLLRGIAAVFVAVHHAGLFAGIHIVPMAYCAVDLFFCLSGFVLENAYRARIQGGLSFLAFARRRLARLYPMYLIGFALGFFVIVCEIALGIVDISRYELVNALLMNALFLPFQNAIAIPRGEGFMVGIVFIFNDPVYSLFFELLINAIFYITTVLSITNRKFLLCLVYPAVVLASLAFLCVVLYGSGNGGWGSGVKQFAVGLCRTIFGFYCGVVIAKLHNGRLRSLSAGTAVTALAIGAFVGISFLSNRPQVYFVSLFISILIVFALSKVRTIRAFTPFYINLGEASYPLYCIHAPILAIFYVIIPRIIHFQLNIPIMKVIIAIIIVAVCYGLSLLFLRGYEQVAKSVLGASRLTKAVRAPTSPGSPLSVDVTR